MIGIMDGLVYMVLLTGWLLGIVVSTGFWSVLFAVTVPPYAIYLVIERVVLKYGLL
jgi:hypothetical protein